MPFVIGVMGIGGLEVEGPIGNFQLAQATVAENPEFKGNVSAVQTGKYWDHELAAIVEKSDSIKSVGNQFKQEKGLSGDALKQAITEYRAKIITPKEEELLKNGVSDGTFHYLGSARIMSGIGKGFAEAMIELQEKKGK
jgi:alpha-galactosidase